jgi:hypothetical protein
MGLNKLNHIYEEPFILNTLRVDNDVAIADQLSVSAVIETLSIKNLIVTENLTAGVTNISGDDQNNIKVGENALSFITNGIQNTAFGRNALFSTNTGSNNVAIGDTALNENASGSNNIAIGQNTLRSSNASGGIAIGSKALELSTGANNTAIGFNSGLINTNGANNTFIGTLSGSAVTSGSNNVIIGANTGSSIFNLSNNIIISDGQGNIRAQYLSANPGWDLGTIISGVWSGTAIAYTKGGTGLSVLGTAGQVLRVNSAATALEWGTISLALPFSNSSGLASFLSDETGTGLVVFNNSPTFAGTVETAAINMNGALSLNNYNITGVNNLEFFDAGVGEGLSWAGGNLWKVYESPDTLTNNAGNLQFVQGAGNTRRMTIGTSGSLYIQSNIGIGDATTSTEARYMEIGSGRTGSGYAYIDLLGDSAYTDYGLRIIRNNGGQNTDSNIAHRGTGVMAIFAQDAGSVRLQANGFISFNATPNRTNGIGTVSPSSTLHIMDAYSATITEVAESSPSVGSATYTSNNHKFVVGDVVTITGASVAGYNGTFTITAITTDLAVDGVTTIRTEFTVANATTGAATFTSGLGVINSSDIRLGNYTAGTVMNLYTSTNDLVLHNVTATGSLSIGTNNSTDWLMSSAGDITFKSTVNTDVTSGTTSATSTFNTTVYSSAEFIVYGSTSSGNYVSKVMMLARGTATPIITEYAILTQGTAPAVTITPSYSAPNAVLTVAVASGTNIEIVKTAVSI